ncbi:MAG: hypothetical protein CM15mP42_03620 [Methanobacteriota archaeon]|nr:MAG: hypothetical protein CM15mP42_03620 [Euryarchaeota archaeon]
MMSYLTIITEFYYPKGGMNGLAQKIYEIAKKNGVQFKFNEAVKKNQRKRSMLRILLQKKMNITQT